MSSLFRIRASFAALALGTIALGLLLQLIRPHLWPAAGDVLGDALWAMMFAWLVGAVAPAIPPWKRAVVALGCCWAVEVGQLYHTPVLDTWRATTIGRLTLGSDFDARDLAAYALGVLGALRFESGCLRTLASVGCASPSRPAP